MKYSKVAAAVAGTVIAVGVGTPAFAAGAPAAPAGPPVPTNINSGVDQLMAAQPLERVLDESGVAPVISTVDGVTDMLQSRAASADLAGQATDALKGGVLPTLTGAVPGAALLGGLPLLSGLLPHG